MTNLVLMMRAGETPMSTPPRGFATMNALVESLIDGAETDHAFMPSDRHIGFCRVCADFAEMTFEHVPPRASGNRHRVRGADMWTVTTSSNPLDFPTRGWVPSQRGIGGYVLCDPCNSAVGSKYATEYAGFAATLLDAAKNQYRSDGHLPGTFGLDLQSWRLGEISRAALIALMDIQIHDRLVRQFPVLEDVVKGDTSGLPPELRLGLTLALGTRGRLTAPIGSVGPSGCSVFAEVAFQPFAWTLSWIGGDLVAPPRTADVSGWLRYAPGDVATSEPLELPVGFIHAAIPGDYRPEDQIRDEMADVASEPG